MNQINSNLAQQGRDSAAIICSYYNYSYRNCKEKAEDSLVN